MIVVCFLESSAQRPPSVFPLSPKNKKNQVHPLHLDGFTDAKAGGCLDHATSLASVGPNGIRAAHANVAAGKPLCHGFDPETWQVM